MMTVFFFFTVSHKGSISICGMKLSGDVLWMFTVLKLDYLEGWNYAISIFALHGIACFLHD